MERPNPSDDPASSSDELPDNDPAHTPRDPKPRNPEVKPLDEEKHIERGIKVNET